MKKSFIKVLDNVDSAEKFFHSLTNGDIGTLFSCVLLASMFNTDIIHLSMSALNLFRLYVTFLKPRLIKLAA